jgi:hypothetical protein
MRCGPVDGDADIGVLLFSALNKRRRRGCRITLQGWVT